jgi:riboflavin synthase
MFTGIIENKGRIKNIKSELNGVNLSIQTIGETTAFRIGGSVAVNGTCLTITNFCDDTFIVDVVRDTLIRTNLSMLRKNDVVNIEFPLKLGDTVEGHFMEGHVDGMGRIVSIRRSGTQIILKVKLPSNPNKYVIKNGSIGIDGISLTVKDIKGVVTTVSLIPFTIEQTNLSNRKPGDKVNIEVDRMAKYIEKHLKTNI